MIDDDETIAARRKLRHERSQKRRESKVARAGAVDWVAHVGLAAYFDEPVARDPVRAKRLAALLVDDRWPWLPCWASFVGKHARDDLSAVRVGGKNGVTPLLAGFASERLQTLDMNRAKGADNFTTVMLDLDRVARDPHRLWITCKCVDVPPGKSFDEWLSLAHELISIVGATHATIGCWPTYTMARSDTWMTRVVLDAPTGSVELGLPADFQLQIGMLNKWLPEVGHAYARHPRWGTYLHAGHIAAIGGVETVRAVVAPARIEQVGDLTYIQLTASIAAALTPEAGAKRRALEALMAPILVGAPRPPPSVP